MASIKERKPVKENVSILVRDEMTGQVMGFAHGHNTVTQNGLNYLAKTFVDGRETDILTLRSAAQIHAATLVIAAAQLDANRSYYSIAPLGVRSMDSGWPQINGSDSGNNPGTFATDITTFKTTFSAAQAIGTIKAIALTGPAGAPSMTSRAIFNFFTLSRAQYRQKTALDLLSVYVGIEFTIP
jgi:hypothetical protein